MISTDLLAVAAAAVLAGAPETVLAPGKQSAAHAAYAESRRPAPRMVRQWA